MLKRTAIVYLGLIGCLAGAAARLCAQNAYVYYSHKPGADTTSNPRLSFVASGERVDKNASERHLGQPPTLQVPRGNQACVVIENANPLLYDYKLESKTITIAAPDGYGDIVTGLLSTLIGIRPNAKVPANAPQAAPPSPEEIKGWSQEQRRDEYAKAINRIAKAGQSLDSVKQASDSAEINYAEAARQMQLAAAAATDADNIFKADTGDAVMKLLRGVQGATTITVKALYKQFTDAQAVGSPQYCVEAKDSAIRVTLKATKKQNSDSHLRPTGSIAAFDAEPISEKNFEVLPVALVTFAVPSARQFFIDNQQRVQDRPDHGGYFPSVGALASYRLAGWVWAGAAVAKGQTSTPDAFLGLVFRNASLVRSLVLGVGAGFASVPTELTAPASLNNQLPSGSELAKVVKKTTQVGLGIVFTMTGLSLTK